jgi:uncharacterized protein (UPF0332 family)
MTEANSLIDRANRYLSSAEMLIREGDFESAVSRTYYAMFYAVEAVLLTKNLSFSSHKSVISSFNRDFIREGIFPKHMSKDIGLAFEKRQLGDYEFRFVIESAEAVQMLEKGKSFVQTIVAWLQQQNP